MIFYFCPIFGSLPLISLTIFSRCLQTTKVIANNEIIINGRENFEFSKLRNIIKGRDNAALTLECRKRMSLETAENIVYFLNDKSNTNFQNIVNRKNLDL